MYWYFFNVLRRVGSDYYVNDIIPGIFAGFRSMIFTQEKISSYSDPCP